MCTSFYILLDSLLINELNKTLHMGSFHICMRVRILPFEVLT